MRKVLLLLALACECMFAQQAVVRTGLVTSGLIAQYAMVDASGTTLPDSSGSGNNGTLVGSPTVGAYGIAFDGATQSATLPAGITSWRTVQIFADFTNANLTGTYRSILGNSSNLNVSVFLNNSSDGNTVRLTPSLFVNGWKTAAREALPSISMLTFVADATTDKFYINDHETIGYYQQNGTAGNISGTYSLASAPYGPYFYKGTIYYALFYNTELTATQVAQNYSAVLAIVNRRGVSVPAKNLGTTSNLVFIGDSITFGQGVATPYPSLVTTADTFTVSNLGIGGYTACGVRDSAANEDQFYNPRARQNVIYYMAGSNDLAGGNASAVWDCTASYLKSRKQAGWTVVVSTLLDRTSKSSDIAAYNAIVRAKWRMVADDMSDVAADQRLGASGANASTVYFQDGVHPTQVGHQIIASIAGPAIDRAVDGNGSPRCLKRSISFSNEAFNVAATSVDIPLFTLPQYAKLTALTFKHSAQFAATGSLTSLTASVGDSSSATAFSAAQQILSTAPGATVFVDCTGCPKSTTMGADDTINAHLIGNTNLGVAAQSITAVTNANPAVLTVASAPATGDSVFISGFTGSWAGQNGQCIATNISATTFSCGFNGTSAGAIAGSPTASNSFLTAGSFDVWACYKLLQ